MLNKFYPYRFELFLITQLAVLFGSLFIPSVWFENFILPTLLLLNLCFGLLLVSKSKNLTRFLFALVILALGFVVFEYLEEENSLNNIRLGLYFIFYALVTLEIMRQVWKAQVVSKNVILGLISGYISLGLLSFFLCLTIEILNPGSFSGIQTSAISPSKSEQLMYFAYITLMTIGYGDILPITDLAQKATMFIGLIGQFYLVILTAIVVGKYINQSSTDFNKQ